MGSKMKKIVVVLLTLVCFNAAADCRSAKVKHKFDALNGYPKGRKGYVVDHVCSLYNGGLDIIENLQYQTIAEGKKKDRLENTPLGKKLWCNQKNSLPKRTVFNCKRG